jgi:hypothetical protein
VILLLCVCISVVADDVGSPATNFDASLIDALAVDASTSAVRRTSVPPSVRYQPGAPLFSVDALTAHIDSTWPTHAPLPFAHAPVYISAPVHILKQALTQSVCIQTDATVIMLSVDTPALTVRPQQLTGHGFVDVLVTATPMQQQTIVAKVNYCYYQLTQHTLCT